MRDQSRKIKKKSKNKKHKPTVIDLDNILKERTRDLNELIGTYVMPQEAWEYFFKLLHSPSKNHTEIFKYLEFIVDTCTHIMFASQVIGLLGINQKTYYSVIMCNPTRRAKMESLLARNKSIISIKSIGDLARTKSIAASIIKLKLSDDTARMILKEKEEEIKVDKAEMTIEEKKKALTEMAKEISKDHPSILQEE